MGRRFLSVVLFAALFACKTPGPGKQIDNPSSYDFAVTYLYTGETFYESVSIRDKTMFRTFFNDNGRCAKTLRSPCWSQEELTTNSATLNDDEVVAFKKIVEDTNFMISDPDPEGIVGKSRFYSYNITVTFKGATHKVITGSFPGSSASPASIRLIYRQLMDLVKLKGLAQ